MPYALPTEIFSLLAGWAHRPDAAIDLQSIFGFTPSRSLELLNKIRSGDFSWLPKVELLSEDSFPASEAILAAYARKNGTIYLSTACPASLQTSVILEEIGHHIDALYNSVETPGDEGALFSVTVRGEFLSAAEITAILNEDDSSVLTIKGERIAVECATTSRTPAPAPRPPTNPIVPIAPPVKPPTTPVTPTPVSTDTISSAVTYNLATSSPSSHALIGTGSANISLTGNSQATNYLQANSGNDTLIAGAAASTTMVGGAGSNFFFGTGTGTNYFTGGLGNSTMVAGNGLATLIGGTGNNSLKAGSGTQSLVGGGGSNILIGGTGSDTLRAGSGTNTLNSGSAVNGGNTLIGGGTSSSLSAGLGNDSLYALSGKATLLGGAGKDILIGGTGTNSLVSGSGLAGGNTLVGGTGSNTIVAGLGADSMVGGSGSNLLIVDESRLATDFLSLSPSSNNTLGVSHSSAFNLNDSLLSNWSGTANNLQTIKDLSGTSNAFILATKAQSLGIHTIIGGAGSETLSIAGFSSATPSSVLLNGAASTLGYESLVGGGTGNDTFLGSTIGHDTMVGVGGNNLFVLSGGTIGLGGDSIVGGTSLLPDTLTFGSSVTLPGTGTGSMSHIGVLALTGGNNNISALGTSGIQTILGGFGGGDLIDASTATFNININEAASTLGDTLTASKVVGVASTLIGSSSGSNLFNVSALSTPVTGGIGVDTLNVTGAGTFTDSLFAHDASIEILQLTSNTSITLGGNALTTGISTVIGGSGSDTFTSSSTLNGGFSKGLFIDASANTGSSSYTGGFGNDTLKISSNVLNSSTVNGGGGINLLELSNTGVSINASTITKFQELSLTGGNNNIYGIGSSGIQTILGGTGGRDTIDASTAVTGGFINESASTLGDTLKSSTVSGAASTLIGSNNSGNYFTVGTEAALILDSLVGGTGIDTLVYGGSSIAAKDFAKDSLNGSINFLSLTGGGSKNFVFDSIAAAAGISTVFAGTAGGDTLDASGYTSGNIFLNASAALVADTLIGGSGSTSSTLIGSQVNGIGTTFVLKSAAQITSDSLYGNQRTTNNILDITTGGQTLNDSLLAGAKLSSVEIISLTGGGNIVGLGSNAQAAKINYVYGSKTAGTIAGDSLSASGITQGSMTLDGSGSSTGDTLVAGVGASRTVLIGSSLAGATNYFQISNASLLGNDSIVGSNASGVTDILQITSAAQKASDTIFAHSALTSHLSILSLTGGGDTLTLGANAEKSFNSNAVTVTLDSLNAGSNYFDGSGLDSLSKLVINAAGNPISGSALGDTILAGKGGNTLLGGIAASANNLFIFNGSNALTNASIIGGGGINTLQVTGNGQILNDNSFAYIAGIDVLNLNSTNGSNSGISDQLTLSGNAASAGITTIIGGSGPSTINASAFSNPSGNALTWNLAKSRGGDSLLGASTGNEFQVANVSNLTNSTIVGALGNLSPDTLQMLSGAQTIGDVAFSHDSNIGELILGTAVNANYLSLSNYAENAGIQTIIGGASKDTIDASAVSSANNIYFDGSIGSGDSILGGQGSNTLIGASAGVNSFVLAGTSFLTTSSIVGGNSGNDTIAFSSQANIQIGDLSNVSNIGALEFMASGGNQITLGTDALVAGISTIIGGQGNDTGGDYIDFSAYGTAGVVMQITDQSYLDNTDTGINSTITGDTGVDTLKFSRDGVSVTDADFANVSSMQVVQTANGNNHFLLGNNFEAAGVQTLIGGTGSDTIDLTDTTGYTPTSVITYNLAHNTSSSFITPIEAIQYASIVGGSGANWMYISNGGNVTDSLFAGDYQANISNLVFDGGTTNATLGTAAHGAGINTIYLGINDWQDTLNVSGFQGKLTVNGDVTPNVFAGTNVSDLHRYDYGFNGEVNVQTSYAQLSNLTYNAHTGDTLHGSGNDSLSLIGTQARAITSDSLNGTFDALVLGNGNNFVQLTSPDNIGLTSIFGGANIDTISTVGFSTLQGVDLVVSYANLSKDSLVGGFIFNTGDRGNDTVTVHKGTTPVNGKITDASFSRMNNIQAIALDDNGGNNLVLGGIAGSVGIHTVYGALGGHDTINASSSTYSSIGGGWQSSVVGSNSTAPWDFTTIISTKTNISTDYITGAQRQYNFKGINVSSHSILEITNLDPNNYSGSQTLYDSLFASGHISGFQELDLDQNKNDSLNANSVTLGSAAQAGGILTLNGGSGSLNLSILNASTFLTYVSGQPGASLVGGTNPSKESGYNTVNILDTASSLADKSFSGMTNFQILNFTGIGSNAVTLAGSAMNAGFTTIVGGTGSNSFIQSAAVNTGNLGTDTLAAQSNQADTLSLHIDGSLATSNSFNIATASQLANDTLTGSSSGKDILTLGIAGDSSAQNLSDAVFLGLKNIGTLNILGVGANSIFLAANAQNAKIGNVILGSGTNLVNASADAFNMSLNGATASSDTLVAGSGTVSLLGGTGSDSLVAGSGSDTLDAGYKGNDTLVAGLGADTFVLANAASGTYYGTSVPTSGSVVTPATNFAAITGFTTKDTLVLSKTDLNLNHYSLGITYNAQAATNTHFGLYDSGAFVADITTDGHFKVNTLSDLTNGHVITV